MRRNNKKGFTIVELVIVIAVIAILAAVLIPTFSGIIGKAHESAALQEATALYKEAYAVAISDGKIATGTGDDATNTETVTAEELTFVFTATNGAIDEITNVAVYNTPAENEDLADSPDGAINGYTVTVTGGVVKVEKP